MMFDRTTNMGISRGISPATITNANTPYVSQILDLQDKYAAAMILAYGGITDADATLTVLLEESNASNMSGANTVAAAEQTHTSVSAAALFSDDDEVRKIAYTGSKRYIRLTITPALNDAGSISIAGIWCWFGHLAPVAQPT